jgi:hypothetical protein
MGLCNLHNTPACRQTLLTNTRASITQHSRFHADLPVRRVKKLHLRPPKETGNKVSPIKYNQISFSPAIVTQ